MKNSISTPTRLGLATITAMIALVLVMCLEASKVLSDYTAAFAMILISLSLGSCVIAHLRISKHK